jgi:N-acetylmuramoyl-L-alanine amidase
MITGVSMGTTTRRFLNASNAARAPFADGIWRRAFRLLCGYSLLFAAAASAGPSARGMYTDALAREQAIRTAMTAADAAPKVLQDARATIAAYEALVRRFPTSGYCDNALWQAGRLALDAFARFGDPADRDAGVKLLRRLAAGYPSSSLVAQVPAVLAGVSSRAGTPKAPAPQSAPATATKGTVTRASQDEASAPRAPAPATPDRIASIRGIRRTVLPDAVRVTIELDGEVPFHDERIANPDRVFLDLPGTRPSAALADKTLRFTSDADPVRQVRVGRHPNNTTRVVLDTGGIASYSVYPLYGPYRLVIDCVRTPPAKSADAAPTPIREVLPSIKTTIARLLLPNVQPIVKAAEFVPIPAPKPPVLASRSLATGWTRRVPSGAPVNRALIAKALAAEPAPAAAPSVATVRPAPPAAAPPAAAEPTVASEEIVSTPLAAAPAAAAPSAIAPLSKSATGGLSIARQLGLGVSRIVIDPGHGGHDPGAKGRGVTEAELVLDIAMRVEQLLQKVPGIEVILTRRTDDFLALPERTAIANREGADLFLSIHANASPNPQAHGIESYFLNFATNTSAAAVAARENAEATLAMGEMPDLVKAIALTNKVDESRDFATHVQRAMYDRLRGTNKMLKDLGVKQAPFVVLIGATMPSVLAEISFVTNPQEARLLKGNAYRDKIAESLFNAIRKYQTSLKGTATASLQ